MRYVILTLGAIFILIGVSVLFDPLILSEFLEANANRPFLYYSAIILRIAIGLILIIMADQSRFPTPVKVLGWLVLLTAFALILISHGQFQELVASVQGIIQWWGRAVAIVLFGIGAFLIYAFPKKR